MNRTDYYNLYRLCFRPWNFSAHTPLKITHVNYSANGNKKNKQIMFKRIELLRYGNTNTPLAESSVWTCSENSRIIGISSQPGRSSVCWLYVGCRVQGSKIRQPLYSYILWVPHSGVTGLAVMQWLTTVWNEHVRSWGWGVGEGGEVDSSSRVRAGGRGRPQRCWCYQGAAACLPLTGRQQFGPTVNRAPCDTSQCHVYFPAGDVDFHLQLQCCVQYS